MPAEIQNAFASLGLDPDETKNEWDASFCIHRAMGRTEDEAM